MYYRPQDTEARLHEEVKLATAELRRSQLEGNELMNISAKVGMHTADGGAAMRRALQKESRALSKLRNALARFEEFMALRGSRTPEGQARWSRGCPPGRRQSLTELHGEIELTMAELRGSLSRREQMSGVALASPTDGVSSMLETTEEHLEGLSRLRGLLLEMQEFLSREAATGQNEQLEPG